MKTINLSQILLFSSFLVIFTTCKDHESTNPFDAACPKEIFTPSNFKADQEGVTVKLSWVQENTNISGFVINRNENDGTMTEVTRIDKTVTSWNDTNVKGGIKYGYRLVAYAGDNLSNTVTTFFTPVYGATVTTDAVSGITSTSAVMGGNVTNEGGATVTERGVCYSTNVNPTTASNKVEMGSGIGAFSLTITGLTAGTTYYARAYGINSQGTTYGTPVTFITSFLTVTPASYNAPKEIGSKEFTVASNVEWQVTSNQPWCTLNANSGKGNGSITVTITENKEVPQRTAILTFTGTGVANQTVTLTQIGIEPPVLTVAPANQNVTNVAGTTTFTITSNVSWTATSDQSWCTVTNTSGTGNTTLNINYEANTSNSQRVANLTISGIGLTPTTVTLTQQSVIPTDGLIAYYPFNDNANDESGNGKNGTVSGATPTMDRNSNTNSAYSFDGINDNIMMANMLTGKTFSISIWYKTNIIDANRHQIISFGSGSSNQGLFLYVTSNKIFCDLSNFAGQFTSNTYTSNEWHHCVISSSNGLVSLYLNNTFRSSFNFSSMNITGASFSIGSLWGNFAQFGYLWYSGLLDDIRIYNRALTESEIQQLYSE